MRVDRLKAAAVLELEGEVAKAKAALAALEATSIEDLWRKDLDVFTAAWEEYETKRQAKQAELAVSADDKGKKKVVRRVKKA
jgi:hypothetical protein